MNEGSEESDRALALRAQAGEQNAFNQLAVRHKARLYRFARRYVGDSDDAYDVVQDTFISAWMALKRYDSRRSFAAWLWTIALNKCRDHNRRQTVRRRLGQLAAYMGMDTSPEIDPLIQKEEEVAQAGRLRQLDQAISALSPFYKEPLLLTLVEELSQEQVAERLNTTTKAIEMRLYRARRKLHLLMSELEGEG